MREVTVRLTDQNAQANYPFVHRIGDRVKSRVDGRRGIVENATFVGAGHPGGAFNITYDIQTDDGHLVQIPLVALEKVKP